MRPVLHLARSSPLDSGGGLGALELLELIDVVHDLGELARELLFILRSETETGQGGDFLYIFVG